MLFSGLTLSLTPGAFHFHNSSLNGALPCRRSAGGITRAGITGRLEAGTLSMEEEEW